MVPICFTRVKALDLLKAEFSGGFEWYRLQEDKALNYLPEKIFPGCILLKLGLGTDELAKSTEVAWGPATRDKDMKVHP